MRKKVKDNLRIAKVMVLKMYEDEFGETDEIQLKLIEDHIDYFIISVNGILYEYER
jgi:hypothetical protein